MQYLADKFWCQWSKQYLPPSQVKQKWFGSAKNLRKDDLVLLLDENIPRGQWSKVIVVEVFSNKTGLVRRGCLQVADDAVLMRDIRKICLLEGKVD